MSSPTREEPALKASRWWPLFLVSLLSLFTELAVVRWLSGEVRLLAYFKNLPLLAAFLGLSVGFALVGKGRDLRPTFAPLLVFLVVAVVVYNWLTASRALAYPDRGQYELVWFVAATEYWTSLLVFLGVVLVFFLMVMTLFIPLGQAVGEEMSKHAPVPAYVVNILASLVGVWSFTLVSFIQSPPLVWLGLAVVGIGVYLIHQRLLRAAGVIWLVAPLVVLLLARGTSYWSPYQRLDLAELRVGQGDNQVKLGYSLTVQQVFYQMAIDLSPRFLAEVREQYPPLDDFAATYNLAYGLVPPGSRVLIVGSGMGNDIAAAVRHGMGHVDAVEIDPTILELGRRFHPEHPYDDPRVTPVVDDARAFFERADPGYDLIVFGLLDTHTLLSSLSSVRLDSYVYTLESFRQVQRLLNNNGKVVVTFATVTPWLEQRFGRMLGQVFGADKVYSRSGTLGESFVAGQLTIDQVREGGLTRWQPNPAYAAIPLTTDDWPYLYLSMKSIPPAYWQAFVVIMLACLLIFMRSFPDTLRPEWHFWLLGAAFLIIEFKIITELALLFGTTWLVNSLAISGVLIMVLLANVLVLRWPSLNLDLAYTLLFASLILVYLFPLESLSRLPLWAKGASSTILLSLPLFFAGVIFSESLRRAGGVSRPIASNFSGTMIGGFLEYGSILWGVKSLNVIAIILYAAAWISLRWQAHHAR